jgi:hypothetical protein
LRHQRHAKRHNTLSDRPDPSIPVHDVFALLDDVVPVPLDNDDEGPVPISSVWTPNNRTFDLPGAEGSGDYYQDVVESLANQDPELSFSCFLPAAPDELCDDALDLFGGVEDYGIDLSGTYLPPL